MGRNIRPYDGKTKHPTSRQYAGGLGMNLSKLFFGLSAVVGILLMLLAYFASDDPVFKAYGWGLILVLNYAFQRIGKLEKQNDTP